MKYRSRTEIISQILHCAANGGCTKTKIMYKAYLSYAQMKEYMKFLGEKDLIKCEEGTSLYKITEKGIGLMRKCEEIREMVSENSYHVDETEYAAASRVFI